MQKREEASPTSAQPAVRQDASRRSSERATRAKAIVQQAEDSEVVVKPQKSKKTANIVAPKKSKKSQAAEDRVPVLATESAAN